ncbi:CBM35 domain-containing protein [Cohnella soli]|uniref:CBM35 domain-containing protein n=1 Tax=Cohnella soli TaxID=425005 RepID=A0ABW0HXB5_9BACL
MMNARQRKKGLVWGLVLLVTLSLMTPIVPGSKLPQAYASEQTDDWAALQTLLSAASPTVTTPISGVKTNGFTPGQLLGNGSIGAVAGDTVSSQKFYFTKTDFWGNAIKNPTDTVNAPSWQSSILTGGGLTIDSPTASTNPASVYSMKQDIQNAQVVTTMQFGSTTVTMTSWISDTDDVFVTELSSPAGSSAVTINADLWVPNSIKISNVTQDAASTYPYTAGVTSGVLWATRENNLNGSSDYKARLAIATKLIGGTFSSTTNSTSDAKGTFTLSPGTPVTLVTSIKSGVGTGSATLSLSTVKTNAINAVNALTGTGISTAKTDHIAWWKDFWMKSFVDLNDSVMNTYYYGALYVLGSSSRANVATPPSMWGNWVTNDTASFGGRYFLNYNAEALYYGAFSSNRSDTALPYINLIATEAPYQQNKTASAGYKGILYQRSLTPYDLVKSAPTVNSPAATKDWTKLQDQKSNGSFAVMPLIWYYEYTGDTTYLQNTLYPIAKNIGAFFLDYVTKVNLGGSNYKYDIQHSSAHEGGDDLNPAIDIGFIKRYMKFLIDASQKLGVDSAMVPTWQDLYDHIAAYPTQNFTVDGVANTPVYVLMEVMGPNDAAPAYIYVDGQPVQLEGSVFPGESYRSTDTTYHQIAMNTLTYMHPWAQTGYSNHNGFPKVWPVAARLGWPAADLFARFKASLTNATSTKLWRSSNITAYEGGGGIETSGGIEGVNSMLMQSEDGVIKLFPSWPTSQAASFKRLLAKGGIEISSVLSGGTVQNVQVRNANATHTSQTVTISSPWSAGTASIQPLDASGAPTGSAFTPTESGGNLSFTAAYDQKYLITGSTSTGPGPGTYEAESATLNGTVGIAACSFCSSGNAVNNIGGNTSNYVTFSNVTVPTAGTYQMDVRYLTNSTKTYYISVNGGTGAAYPLNGTSWSTTYTTTIPVTLNAGTNTIKFYNDTASAPNLDSITVSPTTSTLYEAESATLSGTVGIAACSYCSAGNAVNNIGGNTTNSVTFSNVTVPTAGTYQMEVRYLSNNTKTYYISVNGGTGTAYPLTGTTWSTTYTTTIPITLNAGTNTIKFYNNTAVTPNLDSIVIK